MKQNFKKGFTLIELLVVIAIIGILAAITVVSVQGPRNRANDTRALADLRQVASIMEQFAGQEGTYPPATDIAALETALTAAMPDLQVPLPTGPAADPYDVRAVTAGYCLFSESMVADTDTIVCTTGAQCRTMTDAAAILLVPPCN